MGQTIAQKIIASRSQQDQAVPGEIVQVTPDLVMLYDWPGFDGLMKTIRIDPSRVGLCIDHYFSPPNEQIAKLHRNFRLTAAKYGIEKFYDVGRSGIGFHLFAEKGHIRPGMLVVHADPHVSTLSALGAYCSGIGADMISAFLTGEVWLKVPETIRIHVNGVFPPGVTSRDLFETILADLGPDGAQGKVIEFTGPTINAMSIESRMVLCNSVQYLSAETAIIPPDANTLEYLSGKTKEPFEAIVGDSDAEYSAKLEYDASTIEPMIVTPPDVFYVEPLRNYTGKKIHQAVIGTCASGRLEDLRIAAAILKNRKIHPDVRFLVTPITPATHAAAASEGLIEILINAGALIGPPTCGPCYGGFAQLLAGEVCLSTGTMNIPGRMGSTEAEIFMANPAAVALSAAEGCISDPKTVMQITY